ncbi:MAG: hypothetical protein DRG31_05785 [Deltaproteobacteria bacterium]|nr:MAG: hypothetical protein DRG31_05785 [Deltaproteobacteria bacterium]
MAGDGDKGNLFLIRKGEDRLGDVANLEDFPHLKSLLPEFLGHFAQVLIGIFLSFPVLTLLPVLPLLGL